MTLLAVDTTSVLEQHRTFLLDEIADGSVEPTMDLFIVERGPVVVLGEEPFE